MAADLRHTGGIYLRHSSTTLLWWHSYGGFGVVGVHLSDLATEDLSVLNTWPTSHTAVRPLPNIPAARQVQAKMASENLRPLNYKMIVTSDKCVCCFTENNRNMYKSIKPRKNK